MSDPINHPAHYKGANGIEAIDVIESFGLGYVLGNVVKYVLRCGRKPRQLDRDTALNFPMTSQIESETEDLKKARWYLDHEITRKELAAKEWRQLEDDTKAHPLSGRQRRRK